MSESLFAPKPSYPPSSTSEVGSRVIPMRDPADNYILIRSLGQIGGANHHCMDVVQRNSDKRLLLRKKIKVCSLGPQRTCTTLEIMRSLRHPNILKFADG